MILFQKWLRIKKTDKKYETYHGFASLIFLRNKQGDSIQTTFDEPKLNLKFFQTFLLKT